MSIELNDYGFCIDSEWCYIALSWQILVTAGVIATAYLLFKKWNNRK